MSRKTMSLSSFEKTLKRALKHYHAPETLGRESPLASYYFLGHLFTDSHTATSATRCGQILQRELALAADTLWTRPPLHSAADLLVAIEEISKQPDNDAYAYVVLELRCFHRFLTPNQISDIWETYLPGSRAEHYRDYDRAISKLAQRVLQRLQPTLRLERPPVADHLFGYQAQLGEVEAALQLRQQVFVYGPSGVGKTAFGATLTAGYQADQIFWYTIRPTLNDHLGSLLFALGYFLHQQGASTLWHFLLVNNGKLDDPAAAVHLAQEDLTTLADRPLLLCFDELEQLSVFTPEQVNPSHQQIVQFLESLRGAVALLLMGQRPFIEADMYVKLPGLIAPDIAQLFTEEGIALTKEEIAQLRHHTGGNPRLLRLYRWLRQSGERLTDLLSSTAPRAELYPLIQRLWQRLTAQERVLIQQLSVFRSVVPADAWATEDAVVATLKQQQLVEHRDAGTIALVSYLRAPVYQELTPAQRASLHTVAAEIRLDRAEYTAAAYHLSRAGLEEQAVQLWHRHMAQEMQRGQGGAAQSIFDQLPSRRLRAESRRQLALIRAELQFLQGNVRQGLGLLDSHDWQEASELSVQALGLRGKLQQELGRVDDAVATYADAEALAFRLLQQVTDFHYLAGVAYLRQQQKTEARRAATLAHYHAHCLDGNVREAEGEFAAAVAAYEKALALARSIADTAQEARVHRFLARVYARMQHFAAAIEEANLANAHYAAVGDRTNQEVMRNLMGSIYLETGAYTQVINLLLPAIVFFRRVNNTHFIAATAANLAEAYLKLDMVEQAEAHAHEALGLEEPYIYSHAHYTLGLIRRAQQDLDGAEEHLLEAARFAEQNGDRYLEAHARHALAVLYREQERHTDHQTARQCAQKLAEELTITLPESL
ncbi:MAG: hypothetical protein KDE19_03495 [Caldilineaceae bacterium]|nr:hypothetical protein [Caldilineaceae bacterium]